MVGFCLPKDLSTKFLIAVNDGTLNPFRLKGLSSVDRRSEISKVLGSDVAKEVNTLFEQKLLNKEWMTGLDNWVKQVSDAWDPEAKKSAVDRLASLDPRILNPSSKERFLSDLAADKLGFNVTPDQAKEIFDMTQETKKLKDAWEKTLDQTIPRRSVNDPVQTVRTAYGRGVLDLQDKIESMKPDGRTWTQKALDVLSMPKTVATGILHFSALGVQAWGMISHKVTWEAALEQFKYFHDEDNYKNLMAYIISHPDYEFARDAKLGLTDVTDQISSREEAIQSSILQKMNTYAAEKSGEWFHPEGKPLPINVIGASSRAFTGYLNYIRFNRFVDLLNAARSVSDAPIEVGSQTIKDLGSVVNNFTGRSNLGPADKFANTQTVLNALFFAPRKLGATVQMFNPVEYARLYKNGYDTGNYTAANAAVRQMTGSLIATGSLLMLANSLGYKVDFNPTSANFAKIQTPSGEKLDVTGGNAIWTRLLGRLMTNKEISSHGKEITLGEGYKPTTRADLAAQYLRGKASPVAGALADWMYEQDAIGRPFNIPTELRSRMEPILMSSVLNYYNQNPDKQVSDLPVLAALFGVNVESPIPPPAKLGLNVWGEPVSFWSDPQKTPLDITLDKIGVTPKFPGGTINGVKLTPQQERLYIATYGSLNKQRLDNLTGSEYFQGLPLNRQRANIQIIDKMNRSFAQQVVQAQSKGSDNDIIAKSMKNQLDKKLGNE